MSRPLRPRRYFAKSLLFLLISVTAFAAFWLGAVPQRFSPFPPISLEKPVEWFIDPRLAVLRRDPALCQSILKAPHIDAVPIADRPYKDGCGWINSVRFTQAGDARIKVERLTCEMAAALTLWIRHDVQPLARELLGASVTDIASMGTYDCRNIIGNQLLNKIRSQHAKANAIDIAGFTLSDGRKITLLKQWTANSKEADFLKAIHRRACRYFRVALGPNYNAAHRDHFHFDRGLMTRCT